MRSVRSAASLLLLVGLAACGAHPDSSPPAHPRLGAQVHISSAPPDQPMDDLEQPVAQRLAPQLADDGLTLDYVECPHWSGRAPAVLRCKGYIEGVVAEVGVRLTRDANGTVEFDAWLGHGVVATTRLVKGLQRRGYSQIDCGRTHAYPVHPGMKIVCSAHKDDHVHRVVATVTDRAGHVRIDDY